MNATSIAAVLLAACTMFACTGNTSEEGDADNDGAQVDVDKKDDPANADTDTVSPSAIYPGNCRTDGDITTCCHLVANGDMVCFATSTSNRR